MRMSWNAAIVLTCAVTGAFAQQTIHSAEAHIIRIESGSSYGLSGSGGNLTVEPSSIHSVSFWVHTSRPIQNVRSRISQKDWQHLLASVDVTGIKALPSPTQCLACVDLPETYIVLEFSDGTKKRVDYNRSNPPAALKSVLHELGTLESKYIPPITICPPNIPCLTQ